MWVTPARDIPVIPEVTLSSLMDAVLPPLSSDGLEATFEVLIACSHIQSPDTENPRWTCLPRDPRTSTLPEGQTFKFLEQIAEAIEECHVLESQEWVALSVAGNTTPVSFRRDTSRPDGYIYLKRPSSIPVAWADIILSMEVKNKRGEQNKIDDIVKVIWSMHHIMRTDARRTHVYGLTCENTTARLWYCDRSDFVVSTEFDLNKDWKHLVRIILSILLGSSIQLGFDPTMKATFPDGNSEPSYIIAVHNSDTEVATQYQTLCVLSDVGADSPVSRGTRVWIVGKLVNGLAAGPFYALKDVWVGKLVNGLAAAPFYALKDVWVHDDRTPEHELVLEIRNSQPDDAQHFLTPVDYGYVPHDPATPVIRDNTHKTLRRQELELTGIVLQTQSLPAIRPTSKSQTSKSVARDSIGVSGDIPNSPWGVAVLGETYLSKNARQHYRMVVKEIGDPVHSLRNFTDIFTAIQGGWKGLHAIHRSKRVHRDVSGGNILLVPASKALPKRGVIMDLEYAKKIDDMSAHHDVRTGTEAFMATEVAHMKHLRLGDVRRTRRSGSLPSEDSDLEQEDNTALVPALPPFRHNPLHDMESIWWLCIWVMLRLVPSDVSGEQYIKNYRTVFFDFSIKETFIYHPTEFLEYTTHLSIKPFIKIMSKWQRRLNKFYSDCYEAQDALPGPLGRIKIDEETLQSAYESGKKYLESLQAASVDTSTDFVTVIEKYHQIVQNLKASSTTTTAAAIATATATATATSKPSQSSRTKTKPKIVFDSVYITPLKR
ncbi:unnamed protein product [Rhizoctonia solani]|uniref:Fungal-type protein kinase domain-containing protein n=1 Tax=Rhizoctonia solani TaxID=456999 RepID=A0A8H2X4L2_9AGAM|nr:unnamed protein product [Rhizoctonia solani]